MMIKSVINKCETKKSPFPKLMIGNQTGAVYLAHKEDRFNMTIEATTLHKGKSSDEIGARNKYSSHFFDDFDGSITLNN